jgi:uncharacterized protein
MPRPPGDPLERYVDAIVCAHAELELARDFTLDALPRVQEAGAKERTRLELRLRFLRVAQNSAIEGTLGGQLELLCQRCLGPVLVPLQESFKVIMVADQAALAQEYGEYEPVLLDPTRLDLQWLAEEQGLLAQPLVARHEPDQCGVRAPPREEAETQRPFGNLRDLMRGR